MTKDQKNEVIEVLKGKFSQYNNFYVTDTESLTVAHRAADFSRGAQGIYTAFQQLFRQGRDGSA